MKSFHLKSILLGIGFGTILTAIISMIFMAGNPNNVKLTDQEIMGKAKILGMIEAKSVLAVSGTTDTKLDSDGTNNSTSTKTKEDGTSQKVSSQLLDNSNLNSPTPPPNTPEPEMIIAVVKGDTSESVGEKLLKAHIITDKKAFIVELTKMGLTMEINISQYKIKKGTEIKGIIKMLTTQN